VFETFYILKGNVLVSFRTSLSRNRHYDEAFARRFISIFLTHLVRLSLPVILLRHIFSWSQVRGEGGIKQLKTSKCAGLHGIPSFVITGSSHMRTLLLTYIFNLSITTDTFPSLWKQDSCHSWPKKRTVLSLMITHLFLRLTVFPHSF